MVKFSDKPLRLLASASMLPGPALSNNQLLQALSTRILATGTEDLCKDRIRRAKAIARCLAIKHRHLTRRLDVGISKPVIDAPEMGARNLATLLADSHRCNTHLDYLITHTATPHTQIPGNSAWIADRANLSCPHMELRQACTGFANALFIASGLLDTSDDINTIAISGMEAGSVFFDLSADFLNDEQLLNYMQMGDGAGGILVTAADTDEPLNSGVISDIYYGQIGAGASPGLYMTGAGSSDIGGHRHSIPHFRHNGAMVRERGPDLFVTAISAVRDRGHELDSFDWIIPHQASGVVGKLLSKHTGIAEERFVVDADRYGNLGSAAIWVSFDQLIRSGKLQRGQRALVLGAEATKYMVGGFIYQH